MQMNADAEEVSLFVRDPKTRRFVFSSEAIRALGFSSMDLKQRGYALDREVASPAIAPQDDRSSG